MVRANKLPLFDDPPVRFAEGFGYHPAAIDEEAERALLTKSTGSEGASQRNANGCAPARSTAPNRYGRYPRPRSTRPGRSAVR